MFSVVIPLFNKEKSVRNTILSVLNQTVADFELLVINDGSTDKSREIVAGIQDSRIRIMDKPNGGVSNTRNEGIKFSRNAYVAFLDADDLWEPDFLETIRQLIADYPEAECYATGFACKYDAETLNVFGAKKRGIIPDFFKQMYTGPVMNSSSVCLKKSAFEKVGYFNSGIRRGEDYDMWARIARSVSIAVTPEIKVSYRLQAENRAMGLLHKPQELWLWHIPSESYRDNDEKRFYRRFLHRQVLEYLIKGKFNWSWQIAAQNWNTASWYSYFFLPASIQSRQLASWVKLLRKRFFGKK